jgi:hypothetical protein
MKGFNIFDSEDPWNGLTVKYDCKWPASLVISPQVMDKYSNIFRLLFPIKFVQVIFGSEMFIGRIAPSLDYGECPVAPEPG